MGQQISIEAPEPPEREPPGADDAAPDGARNKAAPAKGEEQSIDRQESAQARIGTALGEWRLVDLLGLGGAAAVYRAVHEDGRTAALKVLHSEFIGHTRARKRLLREAYVANRIQHPGIVRVFDNGLADDGTAYLVLELCDGETLESLRTAAGAGRPVEEVARWIDELCDVLAAAHEQGVVHRDIKPANLILASDGRIRVLDFGIARALALPDAPSLVTRTGAVLGTAYFMSPEQALGCVDDVDARSDVWSVGATMFTLITGQHVHRARTVNEAVVLAATQPAVKVRSIRPDLLPPVAAVIDRALAFDRERRFAGVREMQAALRQAMRCEVSTEAPGSSDTIETLPESSAPVPASLSSKAEHGRLSARRTTRRAGLAVICVTVIAAAVTLVAWARQWSLSSIHARGDEPVESGSSAADERVGADGLGGSQQESQRRTVVSVSSSDARATERASTAAPERATIAGSGAARPRPPPVATTTAPRATPSAPAVAVPGAPPFPRGGGAAPVPNAVPSILPSTPSISTRSATLLPPF
jgi:serine/threonine-protein kinase